MVLGRTLFFLLLALVLVFPFYGAKMLWLIHSRKATGIVWFVGHTLELNGSISQHLVILFRVGNDSITFNTGGNQGFKTGDKVPIRYQRADPPDARIDSPFAIWADTVVNSLLPELFLLVLFLTPNRFDPLIPWKAKVRIGGKPVIKIIPAGR